MRLIPSDPDVATIINRLRDGSLDLQPGFQRGSVWSRKKRQLLVDSILRNWYVPPVHVVRINDEQQVVLDGQQRLRSILDFVDGGLTVVGDAEPLSPDIQRLSGFTYQDLPESYRRRFDRFPIRMFEVIDYVLEEPAELFFRLNQMTALTAAETRNAFFGDARLQVKELTAHAVSRGMTPQRVGFSNVRLSYEDSIARFLWTLEQGTLNAKLTADRVTERYRDGQPFDEHVVDLARVSADVFFSLPALDSPAVRLNKAMVHSWLCFLARGAIRNAVPSQVGDFVVYVEQGRYRTKQRTREENPVDFVQRGPSALFIVLNDRATSRVNDVASVLLRDMSLWGIHTLEGGTGPAPPNVRRIAKLVTKTPYFDLEASLLDLATTVAWGDLYATSQS